MPADMIHARDEVTLTCGDTVTAPRDVPAGKPARLYCEHCDTAWHASHVQVCHSPNRAAVLSARAAR